jgi:hypothetical protein
MQNGRYTLHSRALQALNVLTPGEQERIRRKLSEVLSLPPEHWQERGTVRLSPDEPLYLVRVDDSLRVILREGGERPEVEDIVRHETLQWFREAEDAARA